MGRARDAWDGFAECLQTGNFDAITSIYDVDVTYLEPANPPHNGNLLTQAYLKDAWSHRAGVAVKVVRAVEAADGNTIAVEWTASYEAGGRRWTDMPQATFMELGPEGVTYQRDYS